MKLESNQVREFFEQHQTVRKYKEFALPEEHLDILLYAAQRAPTDATAQLYSILRISDRDLKTKVATLSGNPHMSTASETFIICGDMYRLNKILEMKGYRPAHIPHIAVHFSIGDAVLAGQNLMLAAEMLGYRGCWIGGILSALPELSKAFHLPKGVIPFAGLTIGLSDEPLVHRPRLPRKMVVHENVYRHYSEEEIVISCKIMAPITKRGDWAQTLNGYFGENGSMEKREVDLRKFLEQE